jgi:hypothetical protein
MKLNLKRQVAIVARASSGIGQMLSVERIAEVTNFKVRPMPKTPILALPV